MCILLLTTANAALLDVCTWSFLKRIKRGGAAGVHPGLEDISSPESGIVVLRDQHRWIDMHDIMARLGVEEV